jgi:hypothetical protein
VRLVCLISTREVIHLSTTFVYPPIPVRTMDWSAIDENTYDASYEGEDESGEHWSQGPHGTGTTEQEAIDVLFDQIEEAS